MAEGDVGVGEPQASAVGSAPGRLSRRSVMRLAAGSALTTTGLFLAQPGGLRAQQATPIAEGATAGQTTDLALPDGIALSPMGTAESSAPIPGGVVSLVRPGSSVRNFNPAAFAQDLQIPWSYLEPLVRPDPMTLRPVPWLARRWAWSENGLLLTFTLRDDVMWHDGAELTAEDAAFSFDVYGQDADSPVAALFALVDAIETRSDHVLAVRFHDIDANWLLNVATLPVFSRRQYGAYWEALPVAERSLSGFDWSESRPTGSGPWQIAGWDERRVTFSRFDDYWQQETWLDGLEVFVAEGPRRRLEAWHEGTAQVLWPVRLPELDTLQNARGVLHAADAASVMFAAFNFANPDQPAGSLWSDLRVRQAASMAIDRERYADDVFGGFIRWDAAGAVAQPWANDAPLRAPAHNPEAASILLAEAGWVDYDGDGIREDVNGWPLRPIAILSEDSRPELAAVLARVQRDLAVVGFGLTVETLSPEAFAERWIVQRTYDLIALAYDQPPGFTDFDLYGSAWDIRTNPAGWNPGGYANADADAAIEEFLAAVSIERQASALKLLQRAVDDDLFALWLGFPNDLILVAEGVAGFRPDVAWQTAKTWDLWRSGE